MAIEIEKEPLPDTEQQLSGGSNVVQLAREVAVVVLFVVAPIAQLFQTRSLPLFLAIAILVLIIAHAATGFRHYRLAPTELLNIVRSWPTIGKSALLFYTLFVIWMAISVFWSPLTKLAVEDVAKFALAPSLVLLLVTELAQVQLTRFARAFWIGFTISSILIFLELTSYLNLRNLFDQRIELYDLNRNAVTLTMLFWPALMLIIMRQVKLPIVVIAAVAYLLMIWFTLSQSAQMALFASIVCWALITVMPKLYRATIATSTLILASFPFFIIDLASLASGIRQGASFPRSAEHRILLWQGHVETVLNNLLFGQGGRAHRYLGLQGEFESYTLTRDFSGKTMHPHNVSLEIWVDYGLVGMFLLSATMVMVALSFEKLDLRLRNICFSALVAGLVYSMTGASFMQGWWLSAAALTVIAMATICAHRNKHIKV